MSTVERVPHWTAHALDRLRDRAVCPVCETASLAGSHCRRCGADLTSPLAQELWEASVATADALLHREQLRLRVPRHVPRHVAVADPATARPTGTPTPAVGSSSTTLRGTTRVQSVLAVAGAGLFAIAAVVFTFFNPDLTEPAARAIPTITASALFLVAARWLSGLGLRSSAEAVGALGAVFVALDVYTVSGLVPGVRDPWLLAALGTLLASLLLLFLARRVRIRAWLAPGLVGAASTPALLGLATSLELPRLAGWLASMGAAAAMVAAARRLQPRFGVELITERRVLTGAQVLVLVTALASIAAFSRWNDAAFFATAACALAAISVAARATSPLAAHRWWSFVHGGAAALAGGAVVLLPSVGWAHASGGYFLALATGPTVGLIVVSRLAPAPDAARRMWSDAGALSVAVAALVPVSAFAALTGASTVYGALGGRTTDLLASSALAAGGLALSAVGLGILYPSAGPARVIARALAGILAAGAVLAIATLPYPEAWMNIAVGVTATVVVSWFVRRSALRRVPPVHVPLRIAAHVTLATAAAVSWGTTATGATAAIAIVCAVAALALTAPSRARWVYAGAAYAYALSATAAALGLTTLGDSAVVALTTTAAAVVAIAATFVRRVSVHVWWTILALTAVPFAVSTLLVVRERSGWTALSTALIFALALTLVFSTRRGLSLVLRSLCAAVLVPALAVIVICLGAQFLESSASPVTLPVIAVIVACALSLTSVGTETVRRSVASGAQAVEVGWWFEAATVTTGLIAVVLSLVREASGLPTAALVLTVLAVGSGVAAMFTRRRHLWWVSAAHATGALWTAWAMAGVDVPEPYLLPPALAALAVGLILLSRGRHGTALAVTGLAVAIVTSLVALALEGGLWRMAALLASGVVLVVIARWIPQASPLASMRTPFWVLSSFAAAAATVHAARMGLGLEPAPGGAATLWTAFALASAGGAIAIWAGVSLRASDIGDRSGGGDRARVLVSLGVVWVVAGCWPSIERDWATIWSMWALMVLVLATTVVVGISPRRSAAAAPPVWLLFAAAFATGVVAWSPRDLRVEWFSLPLGAALLIIGAVHLSAAGTHHVAERPTLGHWPHAWDGSWSLLGPGLVVVFSASVAATFTDPLTWRAILVIVMALGAILVGARGRWAAPFVVGVVVLPIENVSAFSVQIGRGIESMPWWITLAAVGAVLLILAVSYERREDGEVTQRLRDLR